MDWMPMLETLQTQVGMILPGLLGALAILLVGWLVALVLRAAARGALRALRANERLGAHIGGADVEGGVARGLYYLVLLIVGVAFLDALDLQVASEPLRTLVDQVVAFIPRAVAAAVLTVVAVALATLLRAGARRALGSTSLDERLAEHAGVRPVSESLAQVLYWLVLLFFLPAILGVLGVQGLLAPVQGMFDQALQMLPNIVAAAVLAIVGWVVARIVRDLVSNLAAAAGADRLGQTAGLQGSASLSRMLGLVVYVLILLPALTAALDALQIRSITEPASAMLRALLGALPHVFAAAVILTVSWFVARFASGLVRELLAGAGLDAVPERLGVADAFRGRPPSQLIGSAVLFFAMLFASVEAANRLGFGQVSELVSTFIAFGGQVLLGTLIIGVGFWLSGLAHGAISRAHGDGGLAVAGLARFSILGLVLAMGLRAMGLADDIVNLAFGLTLGAVAVAFALSFGLGGREAAGRQMEHWLGRLRGGGD